MKTPRAPTPPDPYVQADAQTQANQDSAAYNNAITHGNTYTPLGSSTYASRVDPVTGATVYDQTVSLDPAQQQLLDIQNAQDLSMGQASNAATQRVNDMLGQPMDTSGLPALSSGPQFQQLNGNAGQSGLLAANGPGLQGTVDYQQLNGNLDLSNLPELFGANDLMGARQQVSDALYNQQASYLDPQYKQREAQLASELVNKGIATGSEQWQNLMGNLGRDRSLDYGNARNSAITGSGAEMQRLADIALNNRGQTFNERLSSGNFANNAMQQNNANAFNAGNFRNSAQQQALAEAMARAGFANDAAYTNADFANNATMQNNANALLGAQFQNSARAQGLDEAYAARAQPLNELASLRSATQVDVPQFQAAQNSLTDAADIGGYMSQNYANQLDAYKARMASRNAVLSGLFGLGSAGITAGFGK